MFSVLEFVQVYPVSDIKNIELKQFYLFIYIKNKKGSYVLILLHDLNLGLCYVLNDTMIKMLG